MAEHTGIGWTEATWNPWYGCTKVSPGCAHCYMFREMRRYGRDPEVVQRSKTKFADPLKWKEPKLCFTCSWSDWFHEAADGWRDEAWDIIRRTPQHTYQILTKRPERIAAHLPADWGQGWPNVWLGVSVESWRYSYRAVRLREIPAVVRFVSAEPLLGWLDLTDCKVTDQPGTEKHYNRVNVLGHDGIHWVIVGGESGEKSDLPRPMDLDWARSLRDQCQYKAAFYLKQLGGYPDPMAHEKAVLDGRTWTEMPIGVPKMSERGAPNPEGQP
jgi:protein gp37